MATIEEAPTPSKYITSSHVFSQPMYYRLDFDKIQTLEDVINVLRLLNIHIPDDATNFDKWKAYLKPLK